jgi:uncharacterized OsmC-like protein
MSDTAIVEKIGESLKPMCFEVTPFVKPRPGENMAFEVNVVAESDTKMRKRATVEPNLPSWGAFKVICDEGGALGGDDTAPPPLGYLACGIAFCLLTHLSSYVRATGLQIDNMRVEQRMRFSTSLVTDAEKSGDIRGNCDGLETHVVIDSPEPKEKIAELIAVSEQACMALQSIVRQTPQSTQVWLNDDLL